jgi:hypothetical protein
MACFKSRGGEQDAVVRDDADGITVYMCETLLPVNKIQIVSIGWRGVRKTGRMESSRRGDGECECLP